VQAQELGNELRQLREQKGLTMEQVQNDTKIRSRYLEAIEGGELSVLPGMVYARGFIKSYAEYLGVNGQELLERYGLSTETQADTNEITMRRSARHAKADGGEKGVVGGGAGPRLLPQVVAVVAVLGLISGIYYFVVNKTENTSKDDPQVQTQQADTAQGEVKKEAPAASGAQTATPTPTPTPTPEPPKPAAVITEAGRANSTTTYAVTGITEAMNLEFAAAADCWVQVTADGKMIDQGIIKAGETRTWQATQAIAVRTGNSKHVTMKMNNQPVAFEGQLRGYTYTFQRKS